MTDIAEPEVIRVIEDVLEEYECEQCGDEADKSRLCKYHGKCAGCGAIWSSEDFENAAHYTNDGYMCMDCYHEPGTCGFCAGSGEGMYDGSRCSSCRGSGSGPSWAEIMRD